MGIKAEENKTLTAVDWLWEQMPFEFTSSRAAFEAYQQAKELEKQQIIDAYEACYYNNTDDDNLSRQYFIQTYGGANG